MLVTLTTTLEGADQAVADYESMAQRSADLTKPLEHLGHHMVRKTARVLDSGERGVQSRTRHLSQSLTFDVIPPAEMELGSNRVYAAYQQFGGVITPKQGQFLAIPIADALGARGVKAEYDVPLRSIPDLYFFRSKKGGLFAGQKLGKTKTGKQKKRKKFKGQEFGELREENLLLFMLVTSVVGTDHMYATHDPEDQVVWDRGAASWILHGDAYRAA